MKEITDSDWMVAEPKSKYDLKDFPFSEQTGKIIGICMEIHRLLGRGFLEIVYKDAFAYECQSHQIAFDREKKYEVNYKGIILPHCFYADFVVFQNIIVEIKPQKGLADEQFAQVINYLTVSKCPIGLLLNFGENSLEFRRFAFTK